VADRGFKLAKAALAKTNASTEVIVTDTTVTNVKLSSMAQALDMQFDANYSLIHSGINEDVNTLQNASHTHTNAVILAATTASYKAANATKLAGIATNANKYVHPSYHPISKITGLQTILNSYGARLTSIESHTHDYADKNGAVDTIRTTGGVN